MIEPGLELPGKGVGVEPAVDNDNVATL